VGAWNRCSYPSPLSRLLGLGSRGRIAGQRKKLGSPQELPTLSPPARLHTHTHTHTPSTHHRVLPGPGQATSHTTVQPTQRFQAGTLGRWRVAGRQKMGLPSLCCQGNSPKGSCQVPTPEGVPMKAFWPVSPLGPPSLATPPSGPFYQQPPPAL
jgi:hypothetical protein